MNEFKAHIGTEEEGNTRTSSKSDNSRPSRHRNWCYTDFHELKEGFGIDDDLTYEIWSLEQCPETKNMHRQGYIQLKQPRDLKWLKNNLCEKTHWTAAKGTSKENIAYCSKLETHIDGPFEEGEPKQDPGTRNDLLSVKKLMDEGKSSAEIAEMDEHFAAWNRYNKSFDKYALIKLKCRKGIAPIVELHIGKSGAGKSRHVWDKWGFEGAVYEKNSSKWWDGYKQQPCLLIDDFGWDMDREYMLKLLDRYPLQVEFKGGFVQFNSPYIYITSEVLPIDWENDTAFMRRVNKIVRY